MKAKQQSSLRSVFGSRTLITLGILVLFSCSQKAFAQQWNTNGNDISNANSGNVGVGTTTPGTKLDVAGVTRSQAFNLSGLTAEKVFSILWQNGVANQKVQLYWPASTQVDGIFEITVTGHYWYSNSNGGIQKRIVINGRNIGIINMQQSEVPFRLGFTGNSDTISNIMWDSANSRYYFIVANLDNAQNGITIHVRSITPGPITATADNLNITPIYTTDTTAYPQLFNSFMSGNVGVGTNTPAYKLDVQGGQINASGGLCIAGDCKTAWSQVGGGGSSQWTTSGSNIYYNTGSVGIGIASPLYSLDVNGGVNAFRSKTSSTSASDALATFENPNGIQGIMRANGNLGLGATSPAVRLAINGNGVNVTSTDLWVENNMHAQGSETLVQGGRGRLRVGTAWGYSGIYAETSSTGVNNDLILGASSLNVRIGPGSVVHNFFVPNGNVGVGTTTPVFDANVGRYFMLNGGTNAIGSIGAAGGTGNLGTAVGQVAFVNSSLGTTEKRLATIVGSTDTATNSGVIDFYTASAGVFTTPRMRINSAGNIGVGTTTPGYKLDLQGGQLNASGGLCIAGDCKTAWSQVGGGPWTTSGSNIYFNTGNVGIGTSNPLAPLNISTNNSTYTPTGNAAFRLDNASATGQSPLDFFINGTLRGRVRTDYVGNLTFVANGGDHTFMVGGDYSVGTAAMIVKSSGRVGIGNTTPTYSLDVSGGTNSFRTKAATVSSADAIATFENSSGVQAIIRGNGDVGIGTTAPAAKLHVAGDGRVTGNLTVDGNIAAKYQDVAEWVPAARVLPPGTVVTLNRTQSNLVEASSQAYDTRVAGVISAAPGIALGERSENKVLVATTGRVRIKVDATNGPIEIGDLLVTSEIEGFAMKSVAVNIGGIWIHRPGTIIGKALEPLASGRGEILVLLSLQ